MKQSYITISLDSDNLEHCIAYIRLWTTQNIPRLNDNKTNITYLASPQCVKNLKLRHYKWVQLQLPLMSQ